MSSRPILPPHAVIDAHSMGADFASEVTVITNLSMISYQISWSGSTPVGSLIVQVSNDYSLYPDGSVNNSGTWSDLTSASVSGNTGTGFFNISGVAAHAIRLFYDRSSGTGTMTATVNGKVM